MERFKVTRSFGVGVTCDGNPSPFDGYWLESARFGLPKYAWFVWGAIRRVHSAEVINNSTFGVRPVIEISKSEISY